MKTLARYFVNGLLFLIPVVVTVYVIVWVFRSIDSGVQQIIIRNPAGVLPQWWVTGLGVLISLTVITIVGVLTKLFITQPVVQLVERIFGRLPLVKLLYSSIKDLVGAFVGDEKKFDQPVLVNLLPGSDAKALGFITRQSMEFWGLKNEVAVYFPQSYNFAGSVLIVPAERVKPLHADSADVMAFIVSGGVSGPTESAVEAT